MTHEEFEFLKQSQTSLQHNIEKLYDASAALHASLKLQADRQRAIERRQSKIIGALADAAMHFLGELRDSGDDAIDEGTPQ